MRFGVLAEMDAVMHWSCVIEGWSEERIEMVEFSSYAERRWRRVRLGCSLTPRIISLNLWSTRECCMAFGSGFVVGTLHLVAATSERWLFALTAETLPGELERNATSFLIQLTSSDSAAILAFRSVISFDCCRMRQLGKRNGLRRRHSQKRCFGEASTLAMKPFLIASVTKDQGQVGLDGPISSQTHRQ